ncbi:MAG: hypothetical protein PHQ32_04815 [Firmicutes bacterium]|nr:hypothetical protein [Bacillota bacterium]
MLIISSKSSIIALGGENMIKTTKILLDELKEYVNPTAKIGRLVDSKELVPIVRGFYETDASIPGYYLAPIIYGPSYLSFEFALSYYSLIPETVYNFTSATFEKKKAKQYDTPFGTFTYRDVPSEAYPLGIILHSENGYGFQIASPEKAICDQLYKISPLMNKSELENLLFDDLRIDRDKFFSLNMNELHEIANYFHTKNHKLLQAYVKRRV